MDIKRYFRDTILNLAPYSTARDEYQGGALGVFLDANENPYENGVNRYPDPHQRLLKERLSVLKDVPTQQIFIGNGSDEPIDLVFRVFCEPHQHNAISIAPTYGMYKVAASINAVEMREVQLESDFSLDTEKLLAAADAQSRLLFLCSPNNPTGNTFPGEQIAQIVRQFKGMVVLDEAYIDFAERPGFLNRLGEFDNLIILQTLSKAWGMAGLRLGLAFAHPFVVEILSRVKYPYNINVVTQQMVLEKLNQPIDDQVKELNSQRKRIEAALDTLPVIKARFQSDANFILVRVEDPRGVYDRLIDAGIIVRDRSRITGCTGCLRLSIGTPAENDHLLATLETLQA